MMVRFHKTMALKAMSILRSPQHPLQRTNTIDLQLLIHRIRRRPMGCPQVDSSLPHPEKGRGSPHRPGVRYLQKDECQQDCLHRQPQ